MIQLTKLIVGLFLGVVFISGCNGSSSGPANRHKYQAQKSPAQAEQLKRQALERLRDSVNSAKPLLKMRAIEACVDLGLSNAQSICIEAVSSPVPSLQFAGAMGLLKLPTPAAQIALENRLSSPDASVRLAVVGMAKTLAGEVARYGITVNNIGPGPTTTERALQRAPKRPESKGISLEAELENTARTIPIGRLATPAEQAAAAAFLASELAGYITGVSLLVDGGAVRAL